LTIGSPGTIAKVDVFVGRVNVSRRKETKAPVSKTFEGKMELQVGCSPDEMKFPVLSIPKECFKAVNGYKVRSYQLIFRITIPKSQLLSSSAVNNNNNYNIKNDNLMEAMDCGDDKLHPLAGAMKSITSNCTDSCDTLESGRKRSRSVSSTDRENFQKIRCMRRNSSCGGGSLDDGKSDVVSYVGQVVIWNKEIQEGLIDSDYELALKKSSSHAKKANAPLNIAAFQENEFSWVELDEVCNNLMINVFQYPVVGLGSQ